MSQVTMGNFRWGIARDELVNQKEGDQFYMRALIWNGNWVSFSVQHSFHAKEKQWEDLNLASNMEKSRRVASHYLPMNKTIPQHSGYGFLKYKLQRLLMMQSWF